MNTVVAQTIELSSCAMSPSQRMEETNDRFVTIRAARWAFIGMRGLKNGKRKLEFTDAESTSVTSRINPLRLLAANKLRPTTDITQTMDG